MSFQDLLTSQDEVYFPIRICGNHGDTMIWNGLCQILRETGAKTCGEISADAVAYPVFRPEGAEYPLIPEEATTVLLSGGGNINDIWGFGISLLEHILRVTPASVRVIVGPQSYWFKKDDFSRLLTRYRDREIILFARERYSYELLKSLHLPKSVCLDLDHDLALHLKELRLLARPGSYELACFRSDREATGRKPNLSSQTVKLPMPGSVTYSGYLRAIAGAREVHTDRLHVAIAGFLMGKPVNLYPNNYHKIRGVYEHSLQGGGVRLIES